MLHLRLIVTTLLSNLLFGIAHGGDQSASGSVTTAGVPASATHKDFSCVPNGDTADDVMTVQTTLAGVPATLRVPKAIRKPLIVLWHGLGPAAIDAVEHATKRAYVWTESARQLAERSDSIRHAAEIASGVPPRALLLFHGADDTLVGPSGAASLREALQPYYQRSGNDQRLKLVIASGVSHNRTEPPALQQLRASVADWFNRY